MTNQVFCNNSSLPGLEHDRFRVAAPLADGAKVADRLVVLLLVVDEGGAVRTRPGTLRRAL